MKHYRKFITTALLLSVAFLFGCGPRPPKDMPKTYPCKITITKDGNPIEGVNILLTSSSLLGSISVVGITDSVGVAQITTQLDKYVAKGAPAGEFQVSAIKTPDVPAEMKLSKEEIMKLDGPGKDAYSAKLDAALKAAARIIPPKFGAPKTTPLTIKVEESKTGNEASFELNDFK